MKPLKSTSLIHDSLKSGLASPTGATNELSPSEMSATICVADSPSSIWKAPRAVPNPPVRKDGTGSSVTSLLSWKNVARVVQLIGPWTGVAASATSIPWVSSLPPLKNSVVKPVDWARWRLSSRSLTNFL